jgi:hypothetical protein
MHARGMVFERIRTGWSRDKNVIYSVLVEIKSKKSYNFNKTDYKIKNKI